MPHKHLVFRSDAREKLENVTLEHLGRASRIVVDRDHTTIVAGKGDKPAIAGRCQELRTQIAETTSDYDRVALENAVSVAGVLLLTEATMTQAPRRNPTSRPPRRTWECESTQ